MASIISLLRRIGGAKAAPATGSAGQLALWKAGARPTDALSLYAHDGTQWIEVIDTRGQVVSPHITTIGATAPTSPKPQDMWLNTTTNLLSIWDGAKWVSTDTHQASTSATAPLNPATGMMWLDPAKKDLQIWDGAQWALVAFKNVTNTFTKPQIIDVNDASAALHIKQLGTGDCLRIEDETNPDATPLVVNKDGAVGIGAQPDPAMKLWVEGDANTYFGAGIRNKNAGASAITNIILGNDAQAYGGSIFYTSSKAPVAINANGPNCLAVTNSYGNIDLCTGPVGTTRHRLRITPSGNIGIGIDAPAVALDVVGRMFLRGAVAAGAVLDFEPDATTGDGGVSIVNTPLNGAQGPTIFKMSGTERFSILASGGLRSLSTYYLTGTGSNVVVDSAGNYLRTSSSLKYKKDVESIDPAIVDHAVKNLRPVWYRQKKAVGDVLPGWSHFGLIAEEVAQVEKRLVNYRTIEATHDDDGKQVNTPLAEPIPEDVDYARLSVLLLDKVQRLEARLAKLEARP